MQSAEPSAGAAVKNEGEGKKVIFQRPSKVMLGGGRREKRGKASSVRLRKESSSQDSVLYTLDAGQEWAQFRVER